MIPDDRAEKGWPHLSYQGNSADKKSNPAQLWDLSHEIYQVLQETAKEKSILLIQFKISE